MRYFPVMGILFLGLTLGLTCKKQNQPWTVVTFGDEDGDVGNSVQQTSDGGYIITGDSWSIARPPYVWLIKTDVSCNKVWSRAFGGTSCDEGYAVHQTSDGGYIIAGSTWSYGAGEYDVWLIKTDASGNKVWDRTFGGRDWDEGRSVQQTSDGGYIIAGSTWSYGAGGEDVWLIKTDSSGNEVWDKTFGGAQDDGGNSVQQTSDGGYIVAGYIDPYGADSEDVWLIKTDASGNKVWDKTFGGTKGGAGNSVRQTSDGGYIITGSAGLHYPGSEHPGSEDVWLIKTDTSGNEVWDKTFGGAYNDQGNSVQQTSDGGYIVVGWTWSPAVLSDVWLIKTDASGNKVWDRTSGVGGSNEGNSVQQTSDGGYIIAGSGRTNPIGDPHDAVWLIKTDADGN